MLNGGMVMFRGPKYCTTAVSSLSDVAPPTMTEMIINYNIYTTIFRTKKNIRFFTIYNYIFKENFGS